MHAKPGIVHALAFLDPHIVANLPANAVTVVITGDNLPNDNTAAVLNPDASGVVAVQVGVVILITVQADVLYSEIRCLFRRHDGKQRSDRGIADFPGVLTQRAVQFKAVAAARDQGALDHHGGLGVGIDGANTDGIADLEAGSVRQGNLLVIPVGIFGKGGFDGGFLDQDGFGAASLKSHMIVKTNRGA